MTEPLPPVVYGDSVIDELNDILWRLQVPQNSDAVQRLQRVVVELERARNEAKAGTASHATHDSTTLTCTTRHR